MAPDSFEEWLSKERFARYLMWAAGQHERAADLYRLNMQLSESFYPSPHVLEILLRNRIHHALASAAGRTWFLPEAGVLQTAQQRDQVGRALSDLRRHGRPAVPGAIVSSLTLSFWTTMFNTEYESLWQQKLHVIAVPTARKGLHRKHLSGPLAEIRRLRNRIAHHEPILHWSLDAQHERLMWVMSCLSPATARWCRQHDRFQRLYPAGGVMLSG